MGSIPSAGILSHEVFIQNQLNAIVFFMNWTVSF